MAGIPAESPLVLRGISGFLPQPPYFSGGLRRGFTFGLSARRSFGREECIPCRTERHSLTPAYPGLGLRLPWGQERPGAAQQDARTQDAAVNQRGAFSRHGAVWYL